MSENHLLGQNIAAHILLVGYFNIQAFDNKKLVRKRVHSEIHIDKTGMMQNGQFGKPFRLDLLDIEHIRDGSVISFFLRVNKQKSEP